MSVKKATTTSELTGVDDKSTDGVDLSPTREDTLAKVEELTAPEMKADVPSVKSVKVKSPTGSVTEVPEGIVDALLDSGYSKTK